MFRSSSVNGYSLLFFPNVTTSLHWTNKCYFQLDTNGLWCNCTWKNAGKFCDCCHTKWLRHGFLHGWSAVYSGTCTIRHFSLFVISCSPFNAVLPIPKHIEALERHWTKIPGQLFFPFRSLSFSTSFSLSTKATNHNLVIFKVEVYFLIFHQTCGRHFACSFPLMFRHFQ